MQAVHYQKNTMDMQRDGSHAILGNFKAYAERVF